MFLENGRGEGRGKRNVWLAMGGVRVGERLAGFAASL